MNACAYALAFNAEEEIKRRKDDAPLLERMLGFRHGRGGGLASVLPLDEDTLRVAGFRPPGELRAMRDSTTDAELELVCRLLHAIIAWIPLFIPQFFERFGEKARPLGELARKLLPDLPPERYAFAATAMLASLNAKGHAADDLRRQLSTVTPVATSLNLLATLVPEKRRRAFRPAPFPKSEADRGRAIAAQDAICTLGLLGLLSLRRHRSSAAGFALQSPRGSLALAKRRAGARCVRSRTRPCPASDRLSRSGGFAFHRVAYFLGGFLAGLFVGSRAFFGFQDVGYFGTTAWRDCFGEFVHAFGGRGARRRVVFGRFDFFRDRCHRADETVVLGPFRCS